MADCELVVQLVRCQRIAMSVGAARCTEVGVDTMVIGYHTKHICCFGTLKKVVRE